jgi:hypothetical protein
VSGTLAPPASVSHDRDEIARRATLEQLADAIDTGKVSTKRL